MKSGKVHGIIRAGTKKVLGGIGWKLTKHGPSIKTPSFELNPDRSLDCRRLDQGAKRKKRSGADPMHGIHRINQKTNIDEPRTGNDGTTCWILPFSARRDLDKILRNAKDFAAAGAVILGQD